MSTPETIGRPGGKRDRTRATLIAAALEIIEEAGFPAASLDAIAGKAGMTKGAIYSNFGSKADLLLAAASARGLTMRPVDPWAAPTFLEGVEALARELVATIRRAEGGAKFAAEFQLYALSDRELRAGLASTYEQNFAAVATRLGRYGELEGGPSPHNLAVSLQCISLGLMMQAFITPGAVTESAIFDTLGEFAKGVLAKH